MNLGTVFECAVSRYPTHVALVQENNRYTYAQLNAEVNRVASSLQRLGVTRRDRVMVLLKNRKEAVCLFWAIQKLGAIFTPISMRLSPEDTQYCINDSEPKVVVYESSSRRSVQAAKFSDRPIFIGLEKGEGDLSYEELVKRGTSTFESLAVDDEEIALMLYTSGTTGFPKGVPRSHKNEYASTIAHIIQNTYETFESTLGVMPLYHTMGVRSLLAICVLNGKYVVAPDLDPYTALTLLSSERISCLYMIPRLYHELLEDRSFSQFDLSALRKIGYAGAPMSEALTQKCFQRLRPKHFVNHYGSTEIYTFTTCAILDKKPGCAGKPGIHQRMRLVTPDPSGGSTPQDEVPDGQIGEIIIHAGSDEAFKGYWNRPDATRKAIRNQWYYTGDLGILDEDGDLYIVGRIDEMLISGGENISPVEIEEVLASHPKVAEAAVIGEEDDRWGQIVVAFIVPSDHTVSVQELDQFCKRHAKMSTTKRPRKYLFVEEIPKSPAGKVIRRELRGLSERNDA
ncbi:AMP-binding protein [Brevibacillus agri]|uniref:class I adenylate-forming enzyme family protein n=1 Tax=Brevibacillus agri TaxID=51101 RepID=UPI002E1F88BF|nr:AMP-binding protein [Brevibacillus agri]MED1657204.1 AMP-binding protein [Brevibacillus agri]MED1689631.1 AMP-binding protein [Brevibacillus agri]MED1693917.1 AMP-binding protein [Brevibacillus agri]MED1698293.1 AMP-binding protein [Brevibacillus agri]